MGNPIPTAVKRSQRDYTLAFKLALVDRVEKGEFTCQQAQSLYGIQGKSTVLTWLRKHGTFDWSSPRGADHEHSYRNARTENQTTGTGAERS